MPASTWCSTSTTLIAHASRHAQSVRRTIIGSGTVSNRQDIDDGTSIADGGVGYTCIAEIRMIETIRTGAPVTPFLRYGDSVRLEMRDAAASRSSVRLRSASFAERHLGVIHVDPSAGRTSSRHAVGDASQARAARDAARRRAGAGSGHRTRAARRAQDSGWIATPRIVGLLRSVGGNPRDRGHLQQGPPPFVPYVFADYVANPLVADALRTILGPDAYCEFYNGNTNCPDSTYQELHLDAPHPQLSVVRPRRRPRWS